MTNQPTNTSHEPLLQVKNLSKRFAIRSGFLSRVTGAISALDDVSFDLYSGETLGIVGESGCGKSTLARCILQLLRPTLGEVWYQGKDLAQLSASELRPLRQDLQMIFQNPYASLNPKMSVNQIITEPFEIHKVGGKTQRQKTVQELMDKVGLPTKLLQSYPHELSGGQCQRVGIARALALNPKLIIADEAVSALDVSVQAQILNLMMDLKKELGLTYIFISHNLSVVEYISDRVGVMYLGNLVELATADQLYHDPKHPYTQALLSAIPVVDPEQAKHKKRILLQGDLPSPANPPSGCRFHTRCQYASQICKTAVPAWEILNPQQQVACHHHHNLQLPQAV